MLLPIEIVVRKFRFDNFFIRLTLSFALPLVISLSIIKELYFPWLWAAKNPALFQTGLQR